MKKIMLMFAIVAFLFSVDMNAQEVKAIQKELASTEKKSCCSADKKETVETQKKACSSESNKVAATETKKACCSSKKEPAKKED
jgi:septal ring factor EnvC (AmiA/AmiB activator)